MSNIVSVEQLDVQGKRVLVRVDFNVPMAEDGTISDDSRIRAALPTLQSILARGGAIIAMSHMGRPKGKHVANLSLAPCAERLAELLDRPVQMAADCIGPDAEAKASKLQPGEILLLENLRFHDAETKPDSDPSFARSLAKLGDLYVNDAFGAAHRDHSSTCRIVAEFPEGAAAGLLLLKEVEYLGKAIQNPKRPFYAIVGGAKVSTKLGVMKALAAKADGLFVGGAMVFTLLKAKGKRIGDSLCEDDRVDEMRAWLEECTVKGIKILLPSDLVVADQFSNDAQRRVVSVEEGVPEGWLGLDIGPESLADAQAWLSEAQTILWNGPMGVFEFPNFAQGTLGIAHCLADSSACTIVGGGDSVAALQQAGLADQISHVSTGGGASLEFVEFGTLPALEALSSKGISVKN